MPPFSRLCRCAVILCRRAAVPSVCRRAAVVVPPSCRCRAAVVPSTRAVDSRMQSFRLYVAYTGHCRAVTVQQSPKRPFGNNVLCGGLLRAIVLVLSNPNICLRAPFVPSSCRRAVIHACHQPSCRHRTTSCHPISVVGCHKIVPPPLCRAVRFVPLCRRVVMHASCAATGPLRCAGVVPLSCHRVDSCHRLISCCSVFPSLGPYCLSCCCRTARSKRPLVTLRGTLPGGPSCCWCCPSCHRRAASSCRHHMS